MNLRGGITDAADLSAAKVEERFNLLVDRLPKKTSNGKRHFSMNGSKKGLMVDDDIVPLNRSFYGPSRYD